MGHISAADSIWCAVGTVLALPIAVVSSYLSATRLKVASAFAAFAGCVLGYFATLFVIGWPLGSVSLDGVTVMVGTIFIASMTGIIGALLLTFLFRGNDRPRNTQVEY
jgi:ABC-type phosphate/phosphonate transport system permease subunit